MASWTYSHLWIYDNQHDCPLVEVKIRAAGSVVPTQSITWTSDSKQIFVFSADDNIHCLDASTGTTRSKWPIHAGYNPRCMTLASNGTFVADCRIPIDFVVGHYDA